MAKTTKRAAPDTEAEELSPNIEMSQDGDILTLKIDLSSDLGQSNSGKSTRIASTGGNILLPGSEGVFIGMNIYVKN